MAQVHRLHRGELVPLPHPDIPCECCGAMNMDEEACPHAKDVCVYCCPSCAFDGVDDWYCDGVHESEMRNR